MASTNQEEIEPLLQLLPACTRCRASRKRCDTLLPACAKCGRLGLECVFYDHVTNKLVGRKHVLDMITRVRTLEGGLREEQANEQENTSGNQILTNGDKHVVETPTHRYLGSNAALSHNPISSAAAAAIQPPKAITANIRVPIMSQKPVVDDEMRSFLVQLYVDTIHTNFPIMDCDNVLASPLSNNPSPSPWHVFMSNMALSVACHCLPGNDSRLVLLSDALYRQGSTYANHVMRHQDMRTLQAIVLLSIRALFDPKNGSLGQLVTFANRLAIELGSDTPSTSSSSLRRQLQCAIFCVGSYTANTLDRPYSLVEPDSLTLLESNEKTRHLCSLYIAQSRFRRLGLAVSETELQAPILGSENNADLLSSPATLITFRQTLYLCRPSVKTAMLLLTAYNDDITVLDTLSAHWIFNAASHVLQHAVDSEQILKARILAATGLERCALKWSGARGLQAMLQAHE